MKISFLLPTLYDARCNRRIAALRQAGADAAVAGFERSYYQGKAYDVPLLNLGRIQHGNYVKRLLPLLRAATKVRRATRDAAVLYAFGLDMLLLAWISSLFRSRKLVYEVADIRELLTGAGPLSWCMRRLEGFLLARSDVLVVTSPMFLSEYFNKVHRRVEVETFVLENKVSGLVPVAKPAVPRTADGPLTIGYFGLLRCQESWRTLKEVVAAGGGSVRVYLRGLVTGIEGFEHDVAVSPYLDYGGTYVSPDELPSLYGRIDLAWVALAQNAENIKWARANRFYEAGFFGIPMIGQVGTPNGDEIRDAALGCSVDLADRAAAVARILAISRRDVATWAGNIAAYPPGRFADDGEHSRLKSLLGG